MTEKMNLNSLNLTDKKIVKKSRKFLKIIENTLEDFKIQNSEEGILMLGQILETKSLTLLSVGYLYQLLESRKENFDFIKQIQDQESFEIVNEEHKYMEQFLNQFFNIEVCESGLIQVTKKIKETK